MDFYTMEEFEIIGDALEEWTDYLMFEEDMKTNPYEYEV